jgi:catechol 2,3-dioxygenase-like lactoylglutathione lyase family enzyme
MQVSRSLENELVAVDRRVADVLVVSGLERSRDFYPQVLGAEVYRKYGDHALVVNLLGTIAAALMTPTNVIADKPDVLFAPPWTTPPSAMRSSFGVTDCQAAYNMRRARGAVSSRTPRELPVGAPAVFSAHGVSLVVRDKAAARGRVTLEATSPLVSHAAVLRYARRGYTILFVGHAGHPEVGGVIGEAPDQVKLIEMAAEAETVEVPDPSRIAHATQTTLSLDDVAVIVDTLRRRSRTWSGRRQWISATRRRTARKRCKRWSNTTPRLGAGAGVHRIRRTRTACAWWQRLPAGGRCRSAPRPSWIQPGSKARTASASRPAPQPPSTSSPPARRL